MIKYIDIDIFKQPSDSLIHCCNCFTTMGGGVAKLVKEKYPEAYKADVDDIKSCKEKLGYFFTLPGEREVGGIGASLIIQSSPSEG